MSEIAESPSAGNDNKTLAYIAGAMMILFAPVGVIIAYIDRSKASPLVASHYKYLIGTFWKGLLFTLISVLLMFVIIGFVTSWATGIWYLVRVIKSLVLLSRDEAIAKPSTWWL